MAALCLASPAAAAPRGPAAGPAGGHAAGAQQVLPIRRITINGRSYVAGDIKRISTYIVPSGPIRTVLRLAALCPNAKAYSFVSSAGSGVVAWLPTTLGGCFGVVGGGGSNSPCAQAFRTPAVQDPMGVVGRAGIVGPTYRVFIAGTNGSVCRDLSTQVPGGIWVRTRAAFTGLASGSAILIKCQVVRADGWIMDYISKQTSIPASKSAWWVYDYYVAGNRRFGGVVPSWWGANF